jgi:hydroxyacyl-ACP dehydratase HTD2-like protein with hotdog domain
MSVIKLQNNVIQSKGKNHMNESELIITVKYDTETRTVEGIVSVTSYNWIANVTTDLTRIFGEVYDEALNSMVDQINWDEEYLAYMESKPTLFEEVPA